MCSKNKRAKQKAAEAIRVIINAARELNAAERVLLEEKNPGKKSRAKGDTMSNNQSSPRIEPLCMKGSKP